MKNESPQRRRGRRGRRELNFLESLSARIGENLRLKLFAGLAQPKADPSSGGVLGDTHC